MNTIITIPHGVMRALNCDWDIEWRTQSAGESTGGGEQIYAPSFPRWIGSPRLSLYGEGLRLWRATRAKAQGRANIYRVPLIDRDDLPDPYGTTDYAGRPLNGDYGDGPTGLTVGNRVAGATAVTVAPGLYRPEVGRFISINDWPYLVTDVVTEASTSREIASIQPSLRRAVAGGSVVNFRAHGLFRATDDSMGRVDVGPNGHAEVDLAFQEWITRP